MTSINELDKQYSTEELLNIIEGATPKKPTPVEKPLKKEIEKFIFQLSITKGTTKIPSLLLYDAYKKWNKKAVNRSVFLKYFSEYFPLIRDEGMKYFNLNEEPFRKYLTNPPVLYEFLRREREHWWEYVEKRRKKKEKNSTR